MGAGLPDSVELLDARRLTGLNVIWTRACAVLDVRVADADAAEQIESLWRQELTPMLALLGWEDQALASHRFRSGISLALAAPIDALYAAVEVAQWAFHAAMTNAGISVQSDLDAPLAPSDPVRAAELLKREIDAERHPPTLRLMAETERHGKTFLWDDDHVSVGLGRGSQSWPARELPQQVDWSAVSDVPIGLVTGTNGKTTTVRLASRMLRAAGKQVGLSSTDWIGVNDRIIDRGDYSGPGGARTVLREPEVDVAILETARGGLLRRGLGVPRADAALITNISEDHLGDFGSQDLDELLALKWLVMQALDSRSTAILNADDPLLVARAKSLDVPIIWFAREADNAALQAGLAAGHRAFCVCDGELGYRQGSDWSGLCALPDIPLTMDGVARHNVSNALAASALSHALGADDAAIVSGLRSMQLNDNPGRCNLFRIDGYEVLLDFAHNPDGMAAIFAIAEGRPARRRVLCFGQAGDRTDEQIRALARGAWAIGLERIIISELAAYRRGRGEGEVYRLLRETLLECGATDAQIGYHANESESLADAMAWAEPGDLVIMLALSEARTLIERLSALQAASA